MYGLWVGHDTTQEIKRWEEELLGGQKEKSGNRVQVTHEEKEVSGPAGEEGGEGEVEKKEQQKPCIECHNENYHFVCYK